jgi:hypothetical protein
MRILIWTAFIVWLLFIALIMQRVIIPFFLNPLFGNDPPTTDWARLAKFIKPLVANILIVITGVVTYSLFNFFFLRYFPGKTFWQRIQESFNEFKGRSEKRKPPQ